jgi:hypothetical protein
MNRNTVVVSLHYAGLCLPVVKNMQGEDCVPLKPISDLFGLRWQRQRQKVMESPFLARHFGVCDIHMYAETPQNRGETCILLSRVAAFIMSINPDRVRAAGKAAAADFLEQKLEEWADALHDYEEIGVAVNLNHARAQEVLRKQRASFAQMIAVKTRAAAPNDRQALSRIIGQMAGELGIPYQPDLIEETQQHPVMF